MCLQNLRFVSSSIPEILGESQNLKSRLRPLLTYFFDSGLVSLTLNRHAKFEVCIFINSKDIRGSQNLKSRLLDLGHAPLSQFFVFFFFLHLQPFQRY